MIIPLPRLASRKYSGLLAPLNNRNYRLLWVGGTISVIGDFFQQVALSTLALELTNKPSGWGAVLMVQAVPRALLMLVGGVVTDRFQPRRVMFVSSILQALVVGALAVLSVLDRIALWHLYIYALLFGTIYAFSLPAANSILPTLVAKDQLRSATALSQVTGTLARFLVPPFAGLLIAAAGRSLGFAINAFSFLVVAFCLSLIQSGMSQKNEVGTPMSQMKEGLLAAKQDPVIWNITILATVYFFGFAGATFVGLPALAKLVFMAGEQGVGLVFGATGVGSLLGAVILGSVKKISCQGLVGCTSVVGAGLTLAAAGLAPTLWSAVPYLVLSGMLSPAFSLIFTPLLYTRTPEHVRGRVMSLFNLGVFGLYPLSYGLAGLVGDLYGPRFIVAFGGLFISLAGLLGLSQKPLREV